MIFDEYIKYRILNGPIDMDGAYGYQCMDLIIEYCQKVLELTNGSIGADCAKHIFDCDYLMENVEVIHNYPEFIPEKRRYCCLVWW